MQHSDLVTSIRKVLKESTGWLTSYQILNALPERDKIIKDYGTSGKGANHYYGAATFVAHAAASIDDVEKSYMDTTDLHFILGDLIIKAGNQTCAVFRL